MDSDTYCRILEDAGIPPWSTWIELEQAHQQLGDSNHPEVFERALMILADKYPDKFPTSSTKREGVGL